jgi:hypothetical protein
MFGDISNKNASENFNPFSNLLIATDDGVCGFEHVFGRWGFD